MDASETAKGRGQSACSMCLSALLMMPLSLGWWFAVPSITASAALSANMGGPPIGESTVDLALKEGDDSSMALDGAELVGTLTSAKKERPEPGAGDPPVVLGMLTVAGSWLYHNDNSGLDEPWRYARIELWDADLFFDDLLWTSNTDANGQFTLGPFDNADDEGGGQDIYLVIYTDTSAVQVKTQGILPIPYSSRYPTPPDPPVNNVPDGTYNFGTLLAGGVNREAVHIYDVIVDGYQFVDYFDTAPPKVEARWAAGYDTAGSSYGGGVIYIDGGTDNTGIDWDEPDEWDVTVILHEYGHFIFDMYTPYDLPAGDHTWDQPTSRELAWSEGWGDFFQSAVKQYFGYPYAELYRDCNDEGSCWSKSLETTWHAPSTGPWDEAESTVAGILWDIYDLSNDDYDSDGIGDSINEGFSELWNVVSNYNSGTTSFTIHNFWNGWFSMGYGGGQLMWQDYYEHGINKDSSPPSNPYGCLANPSANTWTNDNTVYIEWSGASDDLSSVDGFGLLWANTPGLPAQTINTRANQYTTPPASDGTWYLSIRAVDMAGNWNGGYFACGPFLIDTSPPSNPSSSTSSHTVGSWSTDSTISIPWSGATDVLSGVHGYSYDWAQSPSTVPDTTEETTGSSTTSPPLADGANWYFHVRTRDNAGNWANGAYHVGPFRIDTNPPSAPVSCTSSHVSGGWSNDNTVDVTWTGASDGSGSGVHGYSYEFVTSAMAPDTVEDTTGSSATSPSLSDDWWYANIRAVDSVGIWSPSFLSCGPYGIDTVAPANPNSNSSSPATGIWSNDNTVSVSWLGATDALSGVYGYSLVWDTSPATLPDTSDETQIPDTVSAPLTDGGAWYIHVRTRDNAGNWASDAYHIGPFMIDVTPPLVTITTPPEGAIVNEATLTVSGTSADNLGLSSVQVRANGGSWQICSPPANIWNCSVTLLEGENMVEAQAFDLAGNPSAVRQVTITMEPVYIVTTSPPDLLIEFDGTTYQAPFSFSCTTGSVHTIGAPSPQEEGTTRYSFLSWSDGGLPSHELTCLGPETFTASFGTEYQVTVDTTPPTLEVLIDATPRTAPFSFWCGSGTSYTLDIVSPQVASTTRYSFLAWSDGGSQSHAITCSSTAVHIASLTTEYQVLITTIPANREVIVDETVLTAPLTLWWASGSAHSADALSPQPVGTTRYVFTSWSDGGSKSHSILAARAETYTATFLTQFEVTVDTQPPGLWVQVDGTWYQAPQTFWWDLSGSHIVDANSTQGTLSFVAWSDEGPRSHAITINEPATYTAAYGEALPPSVSISSPVDGAVVAASSVTVTGTSSNADRVEVRLDGGTWQAATGLASWSIELTGLLDGPHTIEARSLKGAVESNLVSVSITVRVETGGAPASSPWSLAAILGAIIALFVLALFLVRWARRKRSVTSHLPGKSSMEYRLAELSKLRDRDLITEDEYQSKRSELLEEL